MERRINYLLASWSGPRRLVQESQNYLETHINHLNQIKHNLAQVTIGHPDNPNVNPEYEKYIRSLRKLDDGTPIAICRMPNKGMSYGQYSNMFNLFRTNDKFTHFIFIEDDYVPVVNNFDQILVDLFEEDEECGLLCSLVLDNAGAYNTKCNYRHAAISNGVSSHRVLCDVWSICGSLPHHVVYSDNQAYPIKQEQITFSEGFMRAEYTIEDYHPDYRSLYYQLDDDAIRIYGDSHEDIFVPLQFLDPNPTWQLQKIPSRFRPKQPKRKTGPSCISRGSHP